jgi:poly(3-hydroxybutyrate) depolymerase
LRDDGEDAAEHPFIEAYLSVMDLSAPFVLDLVRTVFHDFALPRGRFTWRGERVETAAITRTGLMTVEAALDDVSAPGQTHVAHDLCPHIPSAWRTHHVEPGTGHFGAFHGGHWREGVLPKIAAFIRDMAARAPG